MEHAHLFQELRRFKKTLDQTRDCVFMFDPETLVFFYVNQGAIDQVGYTREELLQMTPLDIKPEIDEARFRSIIAPLLAGERDMHTFETVHRHRDGHTVPVDILLQYVAPDEADGRFVAIVRDITERKRAEQALEERYRELDQFAYVASHDLKAPLRGIANLAQWIEEDLGELASPEILQHLELMRGRVRRMEGLINGLLQYSRVGRTASTVEVVEMRGLVEEIADLVASPFQAAIEVVGELPVIRTNRVLLHQVLANLIENALKHHQGPEIRVRVGAQRSGAVYVISVADNGPGIAPQFHERIFGIFQTLAPRDAIEGSGLGLALVKKIVEHQGGRVWLESEVGQGATFFFTWPVHPPVA